MRKLLAVLIVVLGCHAPRGPSAIHAGQSTLEFLLTASASDFRAGDDAAVRVREVRFGHLVTPGGTNQDLLCGEFQRARSDAAPWNPFATLRTSGYEQWLGAHAAGLCHDPRIVWDGPANLSPSLQARLDAER